MKSCVVGPRIKTFTARIRPFSTVSSIEPVVFVKSEYSVRSNCLLGPSDKQFPFPGNVTSTLAPTQNFFTTDVKTHTLDEVLKDGRPHPDPEHLKALKDTISQNDQIVDWPVELSVQECPRLLMKDVKHLFPTQNLQRSKLLVLNLTQKSENDMSAWNNSMEAERDILTANFISSAEAICQALKTSGYFADFIDPASGRPFLGDYTNHALFETDDAYKYMGFRIEDLGCCKILKHLYWGSHAFVGTIFTDAPFDSPIIKEIVACVNTDPPFGNQ